MIFENAHFNIEFFPILSLIQYTVIRQFPGKFDEFINKYFIKFKNNVFPCNIMNIRIE